MIVALRSLFSFLIRDGKGVDLDGWGTGKNSRDETVFRIYYIANNIFLLKKIKIEKRMQIGIFN